MNVPILYLITGYLSMAVAIPTDQLPKSEFAQAKRDLTLSYSATDIGSKEGTHVKTITVIKNVAGKKDKALKIDPKLHKSEDWGSHFRDNFNSYGVIPDVPDIDELFAYVNKKEEKKPSEAEAPTEEDKKSNGNDEESATEKKEPLTTTTTPAPAVEESSEATEEKVEKIAGDAELIQPGGKPGKVKSQSLDMGKYRVQETMFDVNYSTPQHSVRQYFTNSAGGKSEKYIQSASIPYFYPQPGQPSLSTPSGNGYSSQQKPVRGSVSVTTPSGRTFDVPIVNSTDAPPYIAPNFRKIPGSNQGQPVSTSSQRPYVAPKVRKSYEVQLNNTSTVNNNSNNFQPNTTRPIQPPRTNVYSGIPTSFRTSSFSGYKPNVPRSRGLRY